MSMKSYTKFESSTWWRMSTISSRPATRHTGDLGLVGKGWKRTVVVEVL